jgi:hypothetical protein
MHLLAHDTVTPAARKLLAVGQAGEPGPVQVEHAHWPLRADCDLTTDSIRLSNQPNPDRRADGIAHLPRFICKKRNLAEIVAHAERTDRLLHLQSATAADDTISSKLDRRRDHTQCSPPGALFGLFSSNQFAIHMKGSPGASWHI